MNNEQIKSLSIIAADTGQVFFGATVIPFTFGIDKSYPSVLLSGIILTICSWMISVLLLRKIND
jgi:hypothetical protein